MADEQEIEVSETVSDDATEAADDDIARLEADIASLRAELEQLRTEHGVTHERTSDHETRIAAVEAGASGYAGRDHSHDGYAGADHSHEPAKADVHEESAPRAGHWWYRPIRS